MKFLTGLLAKSFDMLLKAQCLITLTFAFKYSPQEKGTRQNHLAGHILSLILRFDSSAAQRSVQFFVIFKFLFNKLARKIEKCIKAKSSN